MNPANIEHWVVGTALRRALGNPSRAKLQQLARWSMEGRFNSFDGQIDYRANLQRIHTPMLVVAGGQDRLAPPESVGYGFDRMASSAKRFVTLDRASGFSADYGHVDIVFGRRAPDEVFPLVAEWVGDTLSGGGPA